MTTTTLAHALSAADQTITLTAANDLVKGELLALDAEYCRILVVLTPTQALVQRGVNGTPSAPHLVGVTVSIDVPENFLTGPQVLPAFGIDTNVLTGLGPSDAATFQPGGGGGGGNPALPDTSVQFNDSGSFGGSADFTWDGTHAFVSGSQLITFDDLASPPTGTALGSVGLPFDSVNATNAYLIPITAPTTALTAVIGAAGLPSGSFAYYVTFATLTGETETGPLSNTVVPSSQRVVLTDIPVSPDVRVIARKVYRTPFGLAGANADLVATLNDNTTTSTTENVADGSHIYSRTQNFTSAIYSGSLRVALLSESLYDPYNADVFIGPYAGAFVTGRAGGNTFIGSGAGYAVTTGFFNTAIGSSAFVAATTGNYNVVIGEDAGKTSGTGSFNVNIGQASGYGAGVDTGSQNTFLGAQAQWGSNAFTGDDNVGIGFSALAGIEGAAAKNTAVGSGAGDGILTGSSNVLIGYNSGGNWTGSNALFIDVTNTSTPLIGGDFSGRTVVINGTVTATGFLGGTWQGKTLTLSGNLTTTGSFNPTFAIPSSSTWTFPSGGGTLLVGGGSGFVSSITGTANQITASASTGAVTLSIPTNPVFSGTALTFPGSLSVASGKTLTSNVSLTVAGSDVTMTTPSTSFTAARTDSANTFTLANDTTNVIAGGSVTGSGTSSFSSVTGTWNTSGAPTAFKVAVTNTASGAASLLLDLQYGTSPATIFSVRRDGYTTWGTFAALYPNGGNVQFGVGTQDFTGITTIGIKTLQYIAAGSYGFATSLSASPDVFILRGGAAATLQMGADVNGAAVNQTLQAASGITGTDKTGGNLTVASGKGTGAGAVSSLIFQTPTVLSTGTTAQSLATRLTLTSAGATFAAGITTLGGATFHTTSSALTDGAGAGLGTLATAPSAGNPTKWIGINDNGTTRYIPAW